MTTIILTFFDFLIIIIVFLIVFILNYSLIYSALIKKEQYANADMSIIGFVSLCSYYYRLHKWQEKLVCLRKFPCCYRKNFKKFKFRKKRRNNNIGYAVVDKKIGVKNLY